MESPCLKLLMNIADSADYNGVICYILLKPQISFAIQQIIWESVDYEHNWERKREGYFIEVSGIQKT